MSALVGFHSPDFRSNLIWSSLLARDFKVSDGFNFVGVFILLFEPVENTRAINPINIKNFLLTIPYW